eukprot:CAMPEP_0173426142 /NCGR_PEP_ID=MMETSP1357-20121228/5678_1 /TAXON_ID=77926 /ORGANISM="Hemiselmis rufescens, Strain PCC563" /LENGTH=110 /DNA_ID=CAMNT_0014389735 /DNA_START=509 /DNA_END=840 /DNA_ORIENTATION=-
MRRFVAVPASLERLFQDARPQLLSTSFPWLDYPSPYAVPPPPYAVSPPPPSAVPPPPYAVPSPPYAVPPPPYAVPPPPAAAQEAAVSKAATSWFPDEPAGAWGGAAGAWM